MNAGQNVVAVGLMVCACSSVCGAQETPAYRTEVPKITPDRWTQPVPPIPARGKITKADYLKYIQEKWKVIRASVATGAGKPNVARQWANAKQTAFIYRITGDERYARRTMKLIRGDHLFRTQGSGKDFTKVSAYIGTIRPSMMAYHWIRDSKSLKPDDHWQIRKWLEMKIDNYAYYECGAMNRGVGGAMSVMLLNHLYPDGADKPLTSAKPLAWHKTKNFTRRQYVDYTWPMWWDYRDFYENSSGYVSHTLEMIMSAWEVMGKQELHKDPGMRRLAERYLAQVTPNGAMPGYGDVVGFNCDPGRWVLLMETWAKAYNDGRFTWAAHRMFEFIRRHEKEYLQWGNPIYDIMDSLMEAYVIADESIEPVEPTIGSTITQRHRLKWLDQQKTGRHAELTDEMMPNKLILRTGWKPDDAYALVELCEPMSHGHGNTASIECYVVDDSVQLLSPPYLIRSHWHHNSFAFRPQKLPQNYRWHNAVLWPAKCKTTVPVFHKTDTAAFARVHVTHYMNGPFTLDRRVFLLGKQGLWVRDTVTGGSEEFRGTIGPAFQFVGVYPKRGTHWVNACQTSLPVSFIWKPEYMMQFKNRPIDLLVYFVPKPGTKIVIDDVRVDASGVHAGPGKVVPNNFTDRVWYQMKTTLTEGQRHTFDSILLPHNPVQDATPLAKGIQSLLDDGPDRAVVQIKTPDGQSLYVGINADGRPLKAGPIATDAKVFAVTVEGGQVTSHWQVEGTNLTVDGKTVELNK